MLKTFFLLISITFSLTTQSACLILTSQQQPAPLLHDAIANLLTHNSACPEEVFAFRNLIKQSGLTLSTTLVANRGFHNPAQGSFSLFEMASGTWEATHVKPGEFFFGHFTAVNDQNQLIADQSPELNNLMIEAFAWDEQKQGFNFYELRGDGVKGQWYYRGDSHDIAADNQLLHRQIDPQHPQFGQRLRCSACHSAGGPIMKELVPPHNDWWEPRRQLDLGGRVPDQQLDEILQTLVPAKQLAKHVVLGLHKKQSRQLSLQEQLRPLFCPVEVNLKSDRLANENNNDTIAIPADFFVDSNLLPQAKAVIISRAHYQAALTQYGSHFPETELADADHAWLMPVKATSDQIAIQQLIHTQVISKKFAADVLATDMTNPVFSSQRCHLLSYVPLTQTPQWQQQFILNLSASNDKIAHQLAANLKNPWHDPAFHRRQAQAFLTHCRNQLRDQSQVLALYRLLLQRRIEISANEISKNPRGQILEPGFRVIFPESKIQPVAGQLRLGLTCEVA